DDLMFATLDPVSKRLRFPKDNNIIINDTVGFIKNLPIDLRGAFKSTLEELYESTILLHLVDISNEQYEKQIKDVNTILEELDMHEKEQLLVFNKIDLIDENTLLKVKRRFKDSIYISAINKNSFDELLNKIFYCLFLAKKDIPSYNKDYVIN
ncbi:MAG: GTPase, partial [Deferribacterota bacterium]|nr:GTPase [Deferribacterota bacterium]